MAERKRRSRELVCEQCCECCCEKCCESVGAQSHNGSAPLHPSRVHWYEYPAPRIRILVAVRGRRKATGGVATGNEGLLCMTEGA
jgi:hypothetical protein